MLKIAQISIPCKDLQKEWRIHFNFNQVQNHPQTIEIIISNFKLLESLFKT